MTEYLTPQDHNRDVTGMRYVYPVVSRRAGGVSVGINLNTNNACNWRCIYCQVPNLTRGSPLPVDLLLLEQELRVFLKEITQGDFMMRYVTEDARHLQDIAFSGNGEPTAADEFPQAVKLVERVMKEFDLLGKVKLRVITNGSQMDKVSVLDAVSHMQQCNGEVWFKVDAGTEAGYERINSIHMRPSAVVKRLRACASRCETWVQTCVFALDGEPPAHQEVDAYLALLGQVADVVKGVLVYGVVRQSYQPEASRISPVPQDWLDKLEAGIRNLGLQVKISQ
ncbi:MAG TPA: radical SAM protein [Methylophilus sp.]|nr:radical SAM protein [Methylophilus sp.]HQQ32964.1 radical SAM protein [Methylophilus sp.]